ncbi:hypothetical protein [Enterococcus gilvus]|nr:hypothetical protein [Enterococcus gilvus]
MITLAAHWDMRYSILSSILSLEVAALASNNNNPSLAVVTYL